MTKRVKFQATKNIAKAVTKPKMKSIPIPKAAAVEIERRAAALDAYISVIVVGMNITGPWQFDMRNKTIMVPEKE